MVLGGTKNRRNAQARPIYPKVFNIHTDLKIIGFFILQITHDPTTRICLITNQAQHHNKHSQITSKPQESPIQNTYFCPKFLNIGKTLGIPYQIHHKTTLKNPIKNKTHVLLKFPLKITIPKTIVIPYTFTVTCCAAQLLYTILIPNI